MSENQGFTSQRGAFELLLSKAAQHGALDAADKTAIRSMRSRTRMLAPGEDIVCQGERPEVAVLVLAGMVGRYHTLQNGDRQYLSFHVKGDMPDIQSLYLHVMDHSVCAVDRAEIALFPHEQIHHLFMRRPPVGVAFWRMTWVDAAIFRQAITNNSARSHVARLAHFFCEHFFRSREAGLIDGVACSLPLNQTQLGQSLGMSMVSVNRALQELRKEKLVEFRSGRLSMLNWAGLTALAGFDPTYLHVA